MSRCWKCGKKGIFLRLNSDGICLNCFIAEEEEKEAKIHRIEMEKVEKLQRFRTEVFPIVSTNKNIQDEWCQNICNHDDIEQIHRQQRARLTTPILLENDSGFFLSSLKDSIYHCSLIGCTCPDYMERFLPCKHMYRLFYELTIGTTVAAGVKNIADTSVISFYKLPPEGQLAWANKSRELAGSIWSAKTWRKSSEISMLIEANLLMESGIPDYQMLLNKQTKDEIILSLAKKGISGYRPSWSKIKLIDWVIQKQPLYLKKAFKDFYSVGLSPTSQKWAEGIATVIEERYSSTAKPFGDTYTFY